MRFLRRILRPVFCCSALCSRAQSGEEKLSVPHSAVVYFSHTGNTRTVAEHIAELTGADLFEIKSLTQYPKAYYPSTHFVKKEIESGILPEIEPIAVDLSDYEVIFVGSPTWWHHIAGVVQRWLLDNDLRGKTIAPFNTHGGGGLMHCNEDVRRLCPDSNVINNLTVYEDGDCDLDSSILNCLKINHLQSF